MLTVWIVLKKLFTSPDSEERGSGRTYSLSENIYGKTAMFALPMRLLRLNFKLSTDSTNILIDCMLKPKTEKVSAIL